MQKIHKEVINKKEMEFIMNIIKRIALALVIIGAINWGLIGLFRFDLVAAIFGGQDAGLSRLIYTLVGLSGLVSLAIFADLMGDVRLDDDRATGTRNLGYGTEFGEDTDFSRLNERSSKDDRE